MSGVFNAYLMHRLSQGDIHAKHRGIAFLDLLAMVRQFETTDANADAGLFVRASSSLSSYISFF